jgi:hypothetical protein
MVLTRMNLNNADSKSRYVNGCVCKMTHVVMRNKTVT